MYKERNATTNRLYSIWIEFRRRCRNPVQDSYINKKLTYFKKWDDYNIFRLWSIKNMYSSELSIERTDNTKGYYPDNCKFENKSNQQYNMSKRLNSKCKYIGVSLKPLTGRSKKHSEPYRARVNVKGKQISLGSFKTEIDAGIARDKYMIKNNINCMLNFPENYGIVSV